MLCSVCFPYFCSDLAVCFQCLKYFFFISSDFCRRGAPFLNEVVDLLIQVKMCLIKECFMIIKYRLVF